MKHLWGLRFKALALFSTLACGIACGPQLAHGQADSGQVAGIVVDGSGAAIPGATVKVTNVDDGRTATAVSGGDGNFAVPALPRGNYTVKADKDGFAEATQTLRLNVSQVQSLKLTLGVSGANQTVEVTSEAPAIDLASASTGQVIESREITDLPLNGHNFTSLALLTPGVTRGAYGSDSSGVNGNAETFRYGETGGAALSVNGLRQQANSYVLDGIDNNEVAANTIVFFPPTEATNEFRVTTTIAPAQYGHAAGALIQSSIKSGENKVHGSAFEYIRNSAFDASPNYQFFAGTAARVLPFKRNEFGGTAGLPILKNKLFIFGDYHGIRQSQPNNPNYVTVPTALMRTGNFSELLGSGLTSVPSTYPTVTGCTTSAANAPAGSIYDPTTCAPFGGNIIPTNRLNQAAVNYLNAFPLPNVPNKLEYNYIGQVVQVRKFNDFDVRLDYAATGKDNLFVRYSYGQDNFNVASIFSKLPAGFAAGTNQAHPRSIVGGYDRAFTPSLVNQFRYGFVRPEEGYQPPFASIPLSKNLGIANANRDSLTGGGAIIGGSNTELFYSGDGGPYLLPQKTHEFSDTLNIVRGRHTINVGGTVIHRNFGYFAGVDTKGYFALGGFTYPGTGRFTGFETSEALVGFSDYAIANSSTYFYDKNWETGYFVQDDWHLGQRLVLNLGLRYDLYTYPLEQTNRQSNFNTITQALDLAGRNGNSRSLVKTDYGNVAPRLGFAYDLFGNGKTVIKGGYGIFYFQERGYTGLQLSNNPDYNGATQYSAASGYRITFSGQGPLGDNNNLDATQPLFAPTSHINEAHPVGTSVISADPHHKNGAIQDFNLQLGRQFGASSSLNLAYVGSVSHHLLSLFNLNSQILNTPYGTSNFMDPAGAPGTNIGYGNTVNQLVTNGAANYNSVQVSFNHRYSNGIWNTVNYTYSHSLDDSNGYFGTGVNGGGSRLFIQQLGQGPNMALNYANSDQDQRHVFSFGNLIDLPVGKGKRFGGGLPRVVDAVIGGWQWNILAYLQTGTPFDVSSYETPSNRADVIAPVKITHSIKSSYFSKASFAAAPVNSSGVAIRPGTESRNYLHGPGYKDVDTSMIKHFPITERVNVELRAEGFNVLNTPQFTTPDANLGDSNYGLITATRQASERQLQFAFRLSF